MITKDKFYVIYKSIGFENTEIGDNLYDILAFTMKSLYERTNQDASVYAHENVVLDYVLQEYMYQLIGTTEEEMKKRFKNEAFFKNYVKIISDKVFYNEISSFKPINMISSHSPVITTLEVNLNFILDRLNKLHEVYQNDLLVDMFSKAFSMFKSINYLVSNGFETEAFATWRTIHELECVIILLNKYESIKPVYLKHMIYNSAFRNEFEDKDAQQSAIDDLKINMKSRGYKSKDMKKYIEYGWLYGIENVEQDFPLMKLNFRNGLEYISGLERYSHDYELSSEIAHSSPLLIFSNKIFFKQVAIVRSYESFLRLEELFYKFLKSQDKVDSSPYENIRMTYNHFIKSILMIETRTLHRIINKTKED